MKFKSKGNSFSHGLIPRQFKFSLLLLALLCMSFCKAHSPSQTLETLEANAQQSAVPKTPEVKTALIEDISVSIPDCANSFVSVASDVVIFGEKQPFQLTRNETLSVTMQDQKKEIIRDKEVDEPLNAVLTAVCSGTSLTFSLKEKFQSWVVQAVKGCEWREDTFPMQCEAPNAPIDQILGQLDHLKKNIIHSWLKQPYTITRRITLTQSLGRAVKDLQTDGQKLKVFCRVLQYALPAEKPLILNSKAFSTHVCSDDKALETKLAFGRVAFIEAWKEIEKLKFHAERGSVSGVFSVNIPLKDIPLEPGQIPLLVVSLKTKSSAATENQSPVAGACFHPFFYGNEAEWLILRTWDDLNDKKPCVIPTSISGESYLAQMLASETQFTMINGSSKRLRLPVGQYEYLLHVTKKRLQEGGSSLDPQTSFAAGTMEWADKKPSVIVETWQGS